MRGAYRIGTIAGSPVYVTTSWFFVAVLIALLWAPQVDDVRPGLGAFKYVAGLMFAVVLDAAVLVHEAAHALMAKHWKYEVGPITLTFLGGGTELHDEARRPWHEFAIAIVGPLASFVVAAAAFGLWQLHLPGLFSLAIGGLSAANIFIGVLNLLPGMPLDGGRALEAGMWRLTRSRGLGGIVAGWIGRLLAVAALAWPLIAFWLTGWAPEITDWIVAVVIAMFLWAGASASIAIGTLRWKAEREARVPKTTEEATHE